MRFLDPISEWFFPPTDKRVISLFRILLALVTLGDAGTWFGHLQAFFSNAGYVTGSYVHQSTPYSHYSLFFLNDATWFVYVCYALLIIACLSLVVGYASRIAIIVVYVLYISFTSRFPLVIYGGSEILQIMLFFAMLVPLAPFFSFNRAYFWPQNFKELIPSWGIRIIQVNIAFVYFFASVSKFRVDTWFNGTELANTLSTRFSVFGPHLLLTYPILNGLLTYGTLALESTAPFLLLNPATRRFSLVLMFSLHLGIQVFMNAGYFSEIMFVALVCFMTPEDMDDLKKIFHKIRTFLRLPLIQISFKSGS